MKIDADRIINWLEAKSTQRNNELDPDSAFIKAMDEALNSKIARAFIDKHRKMAASIAVMSGDPKAAYTATLESCFTFGAEMVLDLIAQEELERMIK